MTYSPDRAFTELEAANPAPVTTIDRPSADEFLASVTGEAPLVTVTTSRTPRLGPVIAVAAFVVVVLLGAAALLFIAADDAPVDQPTPTTVIPTPTTTSPEATSTNLNFAEYLAAIYTAGEFAAVEGLMAPDASYSWSRSSDFVAGPVIWTRDELRSRYEIDTALNTAIELVDCDELSESRISCGVLRIDDLTRAQRLEPSPDVRWRLTIEDDQIVEWVELTPDLSEYFLLAREPFHVWLDANHPEVEAPYSDLRGQPWRADTDFGSIAPDLVAEYAQSLGVEIEGR